MSTSSRKVSAVVGLSVLESIRAQDRPEEYLTEENPSVTLPRRFGLSEVISSQIRYYEQAVRRKGRVAEPELVDLIALVVRRPDSDQVFRWAGRTLVDRLGGARRYKRILKKGPRGWMARRRLKRDLAKMFGGSIGGFEAGSLSFVSRDPLFLEHDPGGDTCNLVTGLLEAILSRESGEPMRIGHLREKGVDGSQYRWSIREGAGLLDGARGDEPGADEQSEVSEASDDSGPPDASDSPDMPLKAQG